MLAIDTQQYKILNHLVLHVFEMPGLGLMDGRMGGAITFFLIGRKFKESVLIDFAEKLLDNVIGNIAKNTPFSFSSGLCGIGWGLDFLLHEHFISGDPVEICEEIDKNIMQINPKRIEHSLEWGLKGLLHYVLAHLTICKRPPFDAPFMDILYSKVKTVYSHEKDEDLRELCYNVCNFYERKNWNYSFQIDKFISEKCKNATELKLPHEDMSLSTGLCGFLLQKIKS